MKTLNAIRIRRLSVECSAIIQHGIKHKAKGVLGLAVLSTPAMLSVAPAQAQDNADSGEIVLVTGSRIVGSGMQTPTPVTAVTTEELEKLDPGNIVDALDQLPQ